MASLSQNRLDNLAEARHGGLSPLESLVRLSGSRDPSPALGYPLRNQARPPSSPLLNTRFRVSTATSVSSDADSSYSYQRHELEQGDAPTQYRDGYPQRDPSSIQHSSANHSHLYSQYPQDLRQPAASMHGRVSMASNATNSVYSRNSVADSFDSDATYKRHSEIDDGGPLDNPWETSQREVDPKRQTAGTWRSSAGSAIGVDSYYYSGEQPLPRADAPRVVVHAPMTSVPEHPIESSRYPSGSGSHSETPFGRVPSKVPSSAAAQYNFSRPMRGTSPTPSTEALPSGAYGDTNTSRPPSSSSRAASPNAPSSRAAGSPTPPSPLRYAPPSELMRSTSISSQRDARASRSPSPSAYPHDSLAPNSLSAAPPRTPDHSSRTQYSGPQDFFAPQSNSTQRPSMSTSPASRPISVESTHSIQSLHSLPRGEQTPRGPILNTEERTRSSGAPPSQQLQLRPQSKLEALTSPRKKTTKGSRSASSSPPRLTLTSASRGLPQADTPQEYLALGITHHEASAPDSLAISAYCFEQSAKLDGGCGFGMLMWGLALRHGWGCPPDEKKAFGWLRRAAETAVEDLEAVREGEEIGAVKTELVMAIYEVGQSFFHGWGVASDKKMAVSYYLVGARLGDLESQQELGYCYANGKGCKKDLKESAKWYRAAVAQGASNVGLAWIYKEKYN